MVVGLGLGCFRNNIPVVAYYLPLNPLSLGCCFVIGLSAFSIPSVTVSYILFFSVGLLNCICVCWNWHFILSILSLLVRRVLVSVTRGVKTG